jgi:hypothetical protein
MSYDLIFVPRAQDQSWEDALEAAEGDESTISPDPEAWARIVAAGQRILGEVDVFEGDENYELTHEETAIQVDYFGREASVTVPYWYRGDAARAIVDKVYRLGAVVQAETGLPGYDPQLGLSLPDAVAQIDRAVECFGQVAASFDERGVSTGPADG